MHGPQVARATGCTVRPQEQRPIPCRTTPAPRGFLSQGHGLAAAVCSAGPVSPQGAFSTFVYSYAVEKPLSVGHKVAGYLPSLFWGFLTLGQLVSIPISSRVRPATMVFVNMVSGRLLLLGSPGEPPLLSWPLPQDVCSGLDCGSGGRRGALAGTGRNPRRWSRPVLS